MQTIPERPDPFRRRRFGVPMLTLLTLYCAASLGAQSAAPPRERSGVIDGRVFDSLSARPIANAEVHAIGADLQHPSVTFSDSSGRFVFAGLPPGRYALVFFDEALEELAVTRRAASVALANDTVAVELATPSAATVLTATCGAEALRDSTRLLIGRVVDADADDPRANASVVASWLETSIEHGFKSRVQSLTAVADEQGRFGICGVPPGTVTVRAASDARSSGTLDLDTQQSAVLRLRLAVAASDSVRWTGESVRDSVRIDTATVARGTARLNGFVRDITGGPVANARVSVRGTARAVVTDARGYFELDSLPAGSQLAEARAIGFVPIQRVVALRSNAKASAELPLGQRIIALDAVQVEAAAQSSQFERRRRQGNGHFLTPEQIARLRPNNLGDVLRSIPGVHIAHSQEGTVLRGGPACPPPAIFLNGLNVSNTALDSQAPDLDIDFLVDPQTITGIEVSGGACKAIQIWAGFPPP